MAIIILGLIFAVLFFGSFATKRRYGILALGLGAGFMLSAYVASIVQSFDSYVSVPLVAYADLVAVFAPAVYLMFVGPTYSNKWFRIGGSVAFAALGTVLSLNLLTHVLVFDGLALDIGRFVAESGSWIIFTGVALALADLTLTHFPKRH